MNLIILKASVTVGLILVLTWVAEKASPRMAGILSGYPIGTALVLLFYGIQIGPEFAVTAVPYNLLGHVSALSFVFFYYLGARDSTLGSILSASLCGLTGFAATSWVLSHLEPTLLSGAGASFTAIALFSLLLRKIPNATIDRQIHYTAPMILFRLVLSTAMVLAITGLASSVGIRWAGLFSAFPLVVYPLLLLIHLNHGAQQAHTVLKNFPRGLWTVLAYSITVSLTYGRLGVLPGTAAGYLVATVLLVVVNWRIFIQDRASALSLSRIMKEEGPKGPITVNCRHEGRA